MKNFIIKSNEWYDKVKEPKRFLFCMAIIGIPLLLAQTQFTSPLAYTMWGVLVFILVVWRISYPITKTK